MGEDSATPTDSHSIPIITQLSSSKPQKKKFRRKQRKDNGSTKPIPDEATNEELTSTPSCDPPQSGEDRMQLTELMSLCTKLQKQVLDLEEAKTAQAKEIASLKKRVKQLEKRRKSRTSGLKRLRKVGSASRVESSNDVSLGAQEDASKQGRKIADLDADEEVTLIDETQERNDEDLMFDTDVLNGDEVFEEPIVNAAKTTSSFPVSEEVSIADPVTTANEVVTTTSAEIPDELTLAQTLIEIKTTKPKAITTAATTVTPVRPRAKGIIFHDQEEQAPLVFSSQSQLLQAKDKGKAKMVEPEKPLKKIDQIALDEEVTRRLEAQLQAELEEEEERLLAERLQTKEQEELTNEEKARLKEGSKKAKLDTAQESSSKRAGDELVQEKAKKEDLETLWKLVKAEHENTRPEEAYERVLWGDLKYC
ncbi:hypothetical protein Tco_0745872 [Tanacetum coccineum]